MSKTTIKALQLGLHWFGERSGGADRMYAELLAALPTYGVECRGLVAGTENVSTLSGGVTRSFASPDVSILQRWRAVRKTVSEEFQRCSPDLVASHFALYTAPALKIIRQHRLPLVVHFQGPWAGESKSEGAGRAASGVKKIVERTVYRQAHRLIVLSDAFAEILTRNYGIDPARIRVIPPGIDTKRFQISLTRVAARERLRWPADRPIVLAVRRLVHRMGLENLIDAAAEVRRKVSDVLVLIAGKGPLATSLEARIRRLGLEQHVQMLGFVPDEDLPTAYKAADVTIVPTAALEGFGLIVIESLAAGTPALVTPVGGLPEGVRGLSEELILAGSDSATIARGMTDALIGKSTMPSSVDCETFASESFDWNVIGPKIRSVYEEAMSGK